DGFRNARVHRIHAGRGRPGGVRAGRADLGLQALARTLEDRGRDPDGGHGPVRRVPAAHRRVRSRLAGPAAVRGADGGGAEQPVHGDPVHRAQGDRRASRGIGMILMLDNYDSFTWNLVQYLQALGAEVRVERNDALTVDAIAKLAPERIVVSPGPCTPNEAGVSLEVIERLGATTPILGVCLGHQGIGQAYGGKVVRAGRIMHGKTSAIRHRGQGVFAGLPDGYEATRYHSLVVERASLPACLEVTAWTE